jgi:serine/threonine protein kinase
VDSTAQKKMYRCEQCGHENSDVSVFCEQCYSTLNTDNNALTEAVDSWNTIVAGKNIHDRNSSSNVDVVVDIDIDIDHQAWIADSNDNLIIQQANNELDLALPSGEYSSSGNQAHKVFQEDPIPGQLLGNFRIICKIGQGGFGAVYLAEQIHLQQSFAIKILNLYQQSPEAIERFHREARALAKLNHKNIVTIVDFGQIEDQAFYLAMEFIKGKSLQQIIKKREILSWARLYNLMYQLCSVLHYVHNQGILHRDLKPSNILLVNQGQRGERVKLIDFGIAAVAEEGNNLTQTGTFLGSPTYMSPEQARGESVTLDGRTDLYSLGIILFQLLVGQPPFQAPNLAAMLSKKLFSKAPSLAEILPLRSWSDELESFVQCVLEQDPKNRPYDAIMFWERCSSALQAQAKIASDGSTFDVLHIPLEYGYLAQSSPHPAENTPEPQPLADYILSTPSVEPVADADTKPMLQAIPDPDTQAIDEHYLPPPTHNKYLPVLSFPPLYPATPHINTSIAPENPVAKHFAQAIPPENPAASDQAILPLSDLEPATWNRKEHRLKKIITLGIFRDNYWLPIVVGLLLMGFIGGWWLISSIYHRVPDSDAMHKPMDELPKVLPQQIPTAWLTKTDPPDVRLKAVPTDAQQIAQTIPQRTGKAEISTKRNVPADIQERNKPIYLTIRSNPAKASIWHRGKRVGRSPHKISGKSGQQITFELRLPNRKTTTVTWKFGNQSQKRTFSLSPRSYMVQHIKTPSKKNSTQKNSTQKNSTQKNSTQKKKTEQAVPPRERELYGVEPF